MRLDVQPRRIEPATLEPADNHGAGFVISDTCGGPPTGSDRTAELEGAAASGSSPGPIGVVVA